MCNLGTTRASLSCTMEEYEVFMICQKGNIVQKVHPKKKLYFFVIPYTKSISVLSTLGWLVVGLGALTLISLFLFLFYCF